MADSKKPQQLLRWAAVNERTGICRSHAHALCAQGRFPAPIKIGERESAWIASEIDEWVANRIAASRNNDKPMTDGKG